MAGHSKWANIKHRKGVQDAKRGKIYTKVRRKIVTAVQKGGPNPNDNPSLRDAMLEARGVNMPKDIIERAIKSASGEMDEANRYEEIRYEGYGVAGVAVLVECLTNNRNRTVAEVRHAFTKCGGNLGTDGSVAYLFNKKGLLVFPAGSSEDKIMELALEAGAEDVQIQEDQTIEVSTTPETFSAVSEAFEKAGIQPESSEIAMIAELRVALTDKDTAEKMVRLNDMLEELDDVQHVYTNADIAEDLLSQLD